MRLTHVSFIDLTFKINKVNNILIKTLLSKIDFRERCDSLSVLELENRAKGRGLKTTCFDNP